jgi:hypothetical protein
MRRLLSATYVLVGHILNCVLYGSRRSSRGTDRFIAACSPPAYVLALLHRIVDENAGVLLHVVVLEHELDCPSGTNRFGLNRTNMTQKLGASSVE